MVADANSDGDEVQDADPMLHRPEDEKMTHTSFIKKLRLPIYREKFFHTVWICWAFIMLGWVESLFGPTFPDLRAIIQENLNTGSWLFTSTSAGFLVGSVITGVLYEKYNKILLLIVSIFGAAGTTAAIPWCRHFSLMLIVKFVCGILTASLDTGGNSEVVQTWGKSVGPYMQALHFCFALGGMIAPLVAEPFLAERDESIIGNCTNSSTLNELMNEINVSTIDFVNGDIDGGVNKTVFTNFDVHRGINKTIFSANTTHLDCLGAEEYRHQPFETDVYDVYLITAILTALTALPFLVMYYMKRDEIRKITHDETNQDPTNFTNKPIHLKLLILFLLSSLTFVYCGTEDIFAGFLMTFCISQLKWSKSSGSFATSVHWISFGFTRLAAIYFVRFVRSSKLLYIFSILMVISFSFLLLATIYNIVPLIWISIGCAGFSMSVVFPSIFTWTNERVVAVSGRISAMFLTSGSLGIMLFPILFGHMMERFSSMWFLYLLLGQSVTWVVLYTITVFLTRLTLRRYPVEIKIKVEEKEMLSIV